MPITASKDQMLEYKNYSLGGNIVSTAELVHSFIMMVYLNVENLINLKSYEILSEQIERINQRYDIYDLFLKFNWYNLIIRIFSLRVLST